MSWDALATVVDGGAISPLPHDNASDVPSDFSIPDALLDSVADWEVLRADVPSVSISEGDGDALPVVQ